VEIRIFDVEHGFCAQVVADNGNTMLIDCGINASTGFFPSSFLVKTFCSGIENLIISNFDEDHIEGLPGLIMTGLRIQTFTRNSSISAPALRALKLQGGPLSKAMAVLLSLYNTHNSPILLPIDFSGIDQKYFFNSYPTFTDTNNLSLVTFLHYQDIHIVFPGDLETAGWEELLKDPSFTQELSRVNFFVASHHGRKSGYCSEIFDLCSPALIIISDESIQYDTQDVDYAQHARGVQWSNNETRYILTTRKHGMITIRQTLGQGCLVSTAKG
jgi:beta-lactamase superfamily II metal-dependent hydrolase